VVLVFYDREEGPYETNGLEPVLDACPWLRDTGLGFCLEPTDLELQLGCVGSLHATVSFAGRAAHSARPWQGENAIHKAGPFLAELLALAPREVAFGPGLVFREVTSATLAKGGIGRNVVPASLDLHVNVRFAPGRTPEDAERELRARVGDRGRGLGVPGSGGAANFPRRREADVPRRGGARRRHRADRGLLPDPPLGDPGGDRSRLGGRVGTELRRDVPRRILRAV